MSDCLFFTTFGSNSNFLSIGGFNSILPRWEFTVSLFNLKRFSGSTLKSLFKPSSYVLGDIVAAGAIGAFAGIKEIAIISIFAIILDMKAGAYKAESFTPAGMVIAYLGVKLDDICDKSRVKQFHFAFVPMLFLVAALILTA